MSTFDDEEGYYRGKSTDSGFTVDYFACRRVLILGTISILSVHFGHFQVTISVFGVQNEHLLKNRVIISLLLNTHLLIIPSFTYFPDFLAYQLQL